MQQVSCREVSAGVQEIHCREVRPSRAAVACWYHGRSARAVRARTRADREEDRVRALRGQRTIMY